MAQEIAFYLLSAGIILAGLAVVNQRNILHAGLSLIICFWCVAGMYLLLDSTFIAVIQVLIYVGAISVLLLFAIMLTHRMTSKEPPVPGQRLLWGAILSAGFVILGVAAFFRTPFFHIDRPLGLAPTILQLAANFMDPLKYLVPFEIVGILLLVALVGAIIIARKDEPTGNAVEHRAAFDTMPGQGGSVE